MNREQHLALKAELADPKYAGMTNQEKADEVNTGGSGEYSARKVGIAAVLDECTTGTTDGGIILDKLEVVAASEPKVKWTLKLLDKDGVDISNTKTVAMIDQLVTATVLTSDEGDALKAMRPEKSIGEVLGIGTIHQGHVAAAEAFVG